MRQLAPLWPVIWGWWEELPLRVQGYMTRSLEPPLVYVQEGAPGSGGISLQLSGEAP